MVYMMYLVIKKVCYFLLVALPSLVNPVSSDVTIDFGNLAVVTFITDRFLGVTWDSGGISDHWRQLNFTIPRFLTLARGLTPCILRVGGTDADYITFTRNNSESQSPRKPKEYGGHVNFTMSASDWDKINMFSKSVGWDLIFDLNLALRKDGQWDYSNAMDLFKYTVEKGYKLYGWELGNEMNISPQFHVDAKQSAADFATLRKILKSIPGLESSLVIGPDTAGTDITFAVEFLKTGGQNIVDAVTFHHYYMGGSSATVDRFKDPTIMDYLILGVKSAQEACGIYASSKPVWLGETSTTWSAGPDNITQAYVASYMWLDKLGISARYGIQAVLRQTFTGGLINTDSLYPYNDYWISVLYKRIVGNRVFNASISTDRNIRYYAHCTKTPSTMGYKKGSVTIYLMNLGSDMVKVDITGVVNTTSHLYLFSPGDDQGLMSQSIKLNGILMEMKSDTELPPFEVLTHAGPIYLPGYALGFIVLPSAKEYQCMT